MRVAVYGASGHTGRFVVGELLRRGHAPVAIGRDESALAAALAGRGARVQLEVARLDSPESLDRALSGTDAVIHCAGPFLDTARPLIEAALRARIHYFDLTAEQGSAQSTFEQFDAPARERDVALVPAAGFYGGFGDLLTTYALDGWTEADRIDIAIALDSWHPTAGTRRTGQRNTAPRLTLSDGKLIPVQPPVTASWNFPEPFGTQDVVELPFTETILIARHLRVRELRNYLNQAPLRDLRDPATPEPVATDERGRSNQRFLIEVTATRDGEMHRVIARGRDIYAVTAPIVVEAADRIFRDSPKRGGTFALGELVDAGDFLQSLADLAVTREIRT